MAQKEARLPAEELSDASAKRKRPKKVVVIAGVVLLMVVAGLALVGRHFLTPAHPKHLVARADAKPIFVETPEMVTNLDAGPHRVSFAKFQCRIEVGSAEGQKTLMAFMPRIVDLLQTYIREMRPEEIRSETAMFRLHEAFLERALIAAPGAGISDVLFEELIVQ